jgi:outer membrane protein assembly factor BamD
MPPSLTLHLLVLVGILLGACTHKEQPTAAEELLRLGDTQLSRRRETQARQYYEQLLQQYPESEYKAQAQFKIAEALYRDKSYLEARFEYQKFLELYPTHPLASRAQFQIGMCDVQEVQRYDRDQRHTQEALRTLRQFRRQYPQDALIGEAEEQIRFLRSRLAEHEFAVTRFYYRKKAYHAAIGRLLNLMQVYPDLPKMDVVLYMLAESYRAEENYVKAQHVFQVLVDRFPSSTYLARARAQLRTLPETGITREASIADQESRPR